MTTTVTVSIGNGGVSNGYDYGDFNAISSAIPTDLVAADQKWVIEVYSTHGELVFNTTQTISGKTVDATRNIVIKAADGNSFKDHANKNTNALAYNPSNGAAIKSTAGSWNYAFNFVSVSVIKGVQVKTTAELVTSIYAKRIESCIIDADNNSYLEGVVQCQLLINSLIIIRAYLGYNSSIVRLGFAGSSVVATGSTVVSFSSALSFFQKSDGGGVVQGCVLFGAGGLLVESDAPGFVASNCATTLSALTGSTGTGNLLSVTPTDQLENYSTIGFDARVKSGSALINAGTADSTNTGDVDIVAKARSLTTPTIGAWEYVAAGVTATGSLASISLVAPTSTATRAAAAATGSLSGIAVVAPTASATVGNIATGSIRSITLAAPTATASSSVSGSGTLTFPLTNNTGTLLSGETGATVHVYTIGGTHIVTKTGQTTNGSGAMIVTDPLIVAATQYRIIVVLASGDEGLDKLTAS